MRILCALCILASLGLSGGAAFAGDLTSTLRYRLSSPYSSFAVAKVTRVRRDSADIVFTRSLLRRPHARRARVRMNPKYDRYTPGEKLLVNAWDFPPLKQMNWASPSSFFYQSRGHPCYVVAHIRSDGTLGVVESEIDAIVNWLYSTGNWSVRIVRTESSRRFEVVFPDGRHQILSLPDRSAQVTKSKRPMAGPPPRATSSTRGRAPRLVRPDAGGARRARSGTRTP
jgi:hypothetical protein